MAQANLGRGLTTIWGEERHLCFFLSSATGKVLFSSPFALNCVIVISCLVTENRSEIFQSHQNGQTKI